MKTVTAKEFQLNHSYVMKDVANGTIYEVTYHGKPWVELRPTMFDADSAPAGSHAAFLESLNFTYPSDNEDIDYKTLRSQQIREKYGE